MVVAFLVGTAATVAATVALPKPAHPHALTIAATSALLVACCAGLCQNPAPHRLLGMTLLHKLTLFAVGLSYVNDSTKYLLKHLDRVSLRNLRDPTLRNLLFHTLPGYVGIHEDR